MGFAVDSGAPLRYGAPLPIKLGQKPLSDLASDQIAAQAAVSGSPLFVGPSASKSGRGSLDDACPLSASRSHDPELIGGSAPRRGGSIEHTQQIIVVFTHAPELLAELHFVFLH